MKTKYITVEEMRQLRYKHWNSICDKWNAVLRCLPSKIPLNREGIRLIVREHKALRKSLRKDTTYLYFVYKYIVRYMDYPLLDNFYECIHANEREMESIAVKAVRNYRNSH